MRQPTIIYCCKGMAHLSYCIWSVRSLERFNYKPIEVIVSNESEREFFRSHCPGITCSIVSVNTYGYPAFSYKPFVLARYLRDVGIQHESAQVVICDADILWKRDPAVLFERFKGKNWVHKITAVNPSDYEISRRDIRKSNIGLRTIKNYAERFNVSVYPNFIVNAGLFMLDSRIFSEMLARWLKKILALPAKEMLMSEALMSLTYAEMGLIPISDRDNIKHLGAELAQTKTPILGFDAAEPLKDGLYTGYETAKHYYGDQRALIYKDAATMGLDHDKLFSITRRSLVRKNIKTIYYVVDNKGWVQHRRFSYFKNFITEHRIRLLTAGQFGLLWKLGFLRKEYIYFSTWRIVHALLKANHNIFKESDYGYFMAGVTSHSNIGGGLDPLNPIPGRQPKEAFNLAVGLLKRFKLVTVNSMILRELLSGALPNIVYCPNGVDTELFAPEKKRDYNPNCIRIGWAGKVRGPKNFPVMEEALKILESSGGFKAELVKVPKDFKRPPLSFKKMREFYKGIDFYLCASLNEGTPNPALEAGSCGIPVIATRVGNMRELVVPGKNGFFIEPTIDSIVNRFNALKGLTADEYMRMGSNMRELIAKDWSWDARVENFKEAMERLVSAI